MNDLCLVREGARYQKIRGVGYVVAVGGCYVRTEAEFVVEGDGGEPGCERCRAALIREHLDRMHATPRTPEQELRLSAWQQRTRSTGRPGASATATAPT